MSTVSQVPTSIEHALAALTQAVSVLSDRAKSDHAWRIAMEAVHAGILSPDECRDEIILAHRTMHRRVISAVQRLIAEAASRGDDVIRISELNTAMQMAQIQSMPDA